jgi:hypothetical protein
MVIPETIPVFLNGRTVQVAAGATVGQLVAQEDADLATALGAGQARATDARGLPVDPSAVLTAGAILRVFQSARPAGGASDA